MTKNVGQFWIVEGGSIFLISKLPTENNSSYVGKRLDSKGNFLEVVGVAEKNFEVQIDSNMAIQKAKEIMDKKVEAFFS
jgi:hypothetical protein